MDFLFEILFQFLGEVLLQFLVEALFEIGLHALGNTFKKEKHPLLSTIGYALWGGIAGVISLLILPQSIVTGHGPRLIGLVTIPLIAGAAMMVVGQWRSRKGQDLVKLDRFGYAFVFAFVMTLVRFKFLD